MKPSTSDIPMMCGTGLSWCGSFSSCSLWSAGPFCTDNAQNNPSSAQAIIVPDQISAQYAGTNIMVFVHFDQIAEFPYISVFGLCFRLKFYNKNNPEQAMVYVLLRLNNRQMKIIIKCMQTGTPLIRGRKTRRQNSELESLRPVKIECLLHNRAFKVYKVQKPRQKEN
jgi:hypothetical protein